MGDHCFPRGLCCKFWCVIFFFFLLRECLRGWKLLPPNSLQNVFSEGTGLEEKISMMLELIFHAALLSGKTGCYINCCIVRLLCWQDSPDFHPLCRVDCALFYPSQDGCDWLPCWSLLLEYELERQSPSYSSLSIFIYPVTLGMWQTLSMCFWLNKYMRTLPLIFPIS